MTRWTHLALLLALLPLPVLAQTAGGQAPLSTIDPTEVVPRPVPARPPVSPLAAPAPDANEDASPRFVLNDVQFAGARAVPPQALANAWAEYRGKSVSLSDLRAIARRAEAIYAGRGYGFVAVVIAPQHVAGGVVRFNVIEGRISDLSVLGSDPVARRQATAAFQPMVGRGPPTAASLEQSFERAKTVPGLSVAGALRRGAGEGGLDLVVQAKRQEWRTYANFNDLYPDAVGPFGVLFGVDHFGSSTYGDQTSAQVYTSLSSGNQTMLRLSHEQGLNAAGTRLSVAGFAAWAHPEGDVAPIDFATDVLAGRIALSQPLVQRFAGDVLLTGAFDADRQRTRVFGSHGLSTDELRIASLDLAGERRWADGGRVAISLEVRKGLDILGASGTGDADLSRPDADPQATVGRFNLESESPVFHSVQLAMKADGQLASAPLTEPEQYAVGNLSIGRGYQPGANYGDDALGAAWEVRFGPFPAFHRGQMTPFAFYDLIKVWSRGASNAQDRTLASVGGGVRFDMPNRLHVELAYAQPLDAPLGLGEPRPGGRILINVTAGLNDVFSAIHRRMSARGSQ